MEKDKWEDMDTIPVEDHWRQWLIVEALPKILDRVGLKMQKCFKIHSDGYGYNDYRIVRKNAVEYMKDRLDENNK